MPLAPPINEIQQPEVGIYGLPVGASAGSMALLSAAQIRALAETYSASQVDTGLAGKANTSHSHSASDVTSGTFDVARLGSGSAGAGAKYLADDATWKTIDLSAYLTSSTAASTYLPLAGGTLVGQLTTPYGDSTNPSILIGNTDTGIHGLNGASRRIRFTVGGTLTSEYFAGGSLINGTIQFGTIGSSANTGLVSPSSAVLDIRQIYSNTTAQTLRLNNTWTSSTSFEVLQFKANAGAAYQIGSAKGSAGGNNQAIELGHWDGSGTFVSRFYLNTSGQVGIGISPTGSHKCDIHYTGAIVGMGVGDLSGSGPLLYYGNDGSNPYIMSRNAHGLAFGCNNRTTDFVLSINGDASFAPAATGSVSRTAFTITDAAHTTMAASTEATSVNFNLSSTKQFATGALTTQRAMRIQAPTYSFVGASTITTASTLSISGAPIAGTNATITNAYALNIESGTSKFGGAIAPATLADAAAPNGSIYYSSDAGKLVFKDSGGTVNNLY